MTTMASGRSRRAGISTCSTKARNTRRAGCRGDAHAGDHAVERKRAEHGQPLPVPPRHLAHGALACAARRVGPGHPGVDPALIEEDEPLRVDRGQLGPPPSAPGRRSGRSCSAARSVFSTRQAQLLERPAHGRRPPSPPARSTSSCAYSAKVRSLRSATSSLSVSKAFASRRRLDPYHAAHRPLPLAPRHACCQRRAPRTGPRRPAQPAPHARPQHPIPQARPC